MIPMNPAGKFRSEVVRIVSAKAGLPKDKIEGLLEKPPENIGADLALPCFRLDKNPAEFAKSLAGKIKPSDLVKDVNFYGPYVNFYAEWGKLGGDVLRQILKEKGKYGRSGQSGKRIMVEFAQPNTHKAFHIGHVRNISLGESLCRILESAGNRVVRTNYQGDIGPHVAKCIWGLLKLHKGREPNKGRGRWLGEVYKEASLKIEKNKKYEEEMREINKKLYSQDREMIPIWSKTRKWSLDYFDGIYRDFGAKFDRLYFESETEGPGKKTALELLDRKIAERSDDAVVVDLKKHGMGVVVLLTKEGNPLYHAKDLALAEMQYREYRPDRIIHVVGSEQNLYFRQLFKMLEVMGWEHYEKEFHMSYGLVNLESGKMKSREGKVILYEELKDKLLKLAIKETGKRNPKLPKGEIERTAYTIAMGALKYTMISQSPEKVIVFEWDKVLSFDGDTAPYIQYSHARACSILRKAKKSPLKFDAKLLVKEEEKTLISHLMDFPETVSRAARDYRPHYVANYAYRLATLFNDFYQSLPVLKADPKTKQARLALVMAVQVTLKNSLGLLGIEAPERM